MTNFSSKHSLVKPSRVLVGSTNISKSSSCSTLTTLKPKFSYQYSGPFRGNDPTPSKEGKEVEIFNPIVKKCGNCRQLKSSCSNRSSTNFENNMAQSRPSTSNAILEKSGHKYKKNSPDKLCKLAVKSKSETSLENTDMYSLQKCREKLHEKAVTKFGSIRSMFRAFDEDGHGSLSLDQFHSASKRFGLEFTPEEEKMMYKWVDTDQSNTIEFSEFSNMFEVHKVISPFDVCGNANADLKKRLTIDYSKVCKKKVERCKNAFLTQLHKNHGYQKVAYGSNDNLLINAFQQMDSDGDGKLTMDELKASLDRSFLGRDINQSDLDYMMQTVDTDHNGSVSFKEFLKYFSDKNDDPDREIFHDCRNTELMRMKQMIDSPLNILKPKNAEICGHTFPLKLNPINIDQNKPAEGENKCLQENLSDTHCKIFSNKIGNNSRLGKSDSANNSNSNLSKNASLNEVFDSLLNPQTNKIERLASMNDGKTDWKRVGFGGDGICKNSSLYQPPSEQFFTMNNEFYSGNRENNMSRNEIKLRKEKFNDVVLKKERVLKRVDKCLENANRIREAMSRRSCIKKTREKYCYLEQIYSKDDKTYRKSNRMQKRHGGAGFHRMWTGTLESQFNTAPPLHD